MDHMIQWQLEHHDHEQCNGATARARRSRSSSVSQVAFALAAIAFLSLFASTFATAMRATSLSSSLPARLVALCGGFAMTKKALFVLSNAIFVFLAADCRCFFGICGLSSSSTIGDGGAAACERFAAVPAKQVHHHHHHQEMEQCAPYPGDLYHNNGNIAPENYTHPARKDGESMSNSRVSEVAMPSEEQPELSMLDDEAGSVALETVAVEEPACGAAQELEKLEIDELNRKFEEFIQSRRIRWINEEEEALIAMKAQMARPRSTEAR